MVFSDVVVSLSGLGDLSDAVGSDGCCGSKCAQTGLAGLADPGALAKRTRSGGVVRIHGAAAAPPD